jgi:hypothetical protein
VALKRRDFLVSGAVLLAVFALPPYLRRLRPRFEFEPLPGTAGFRKLGLGPVSGGPDIFLGLDGVAEDLSEARTAFYTAPCQTLFGTPDAPDDRVPIAIFSDYNCPYCSVLSARLIRLVQNDAAIRLVWYELPLLGDRSVRAAHLALGAGLQGKYIAAHQYLMHKVLPPGQTGVQQFADELGLDANRLIADLNGAPVQDELRKARALAGIFGVIGTPTTIVGRTVVVGAISESDLLHLIDLERSEADRFCA